MSFAAKYIVNCFDNLVLLLVVVVVVVRVCVCESWVRAAAVSTAKGGLLQRAAAAY